MLSPTDLALIRDEVGTSPTDTTLEEWHDELDHWLPVAIRVLKRRLADATAGGTEVSSFGLDGVLTVGFAKASQASLAAQIARLEARWAAIDAPGTSSFSARITRPDRHR